MKQQVYIAIFFAVVFFGKFLMLDAKMLGSILEMEEIVWVNPYCENNKLKENQKLQNEFTTPTNTLIFAVDAFCNPVFNLEVQNWSIIEISFNFRPYSYKTPSITTTYIIKFYPPPKFLIA